jgi:hypothetical protein
MFMLLSSLHHGKLLVFLDSSIRKFFCAKNSMHTLTS